MRQWQPLINSTIDKLPVWLVGAPVTSAILQEWGDYRLSAWIMLAWLISVIVLIVLAVTHKRNR